MKRISTRTDGLEVVQTTPSAALRALGEKEITIGGRHFNPARFGRWILGVKPPLQDEQIRSRKVSADETHTDFTLDGVEVVRASAIGPSARDRQLTIVGRPGRNTEQLDEKSRLRLVAGHAIAAVSSDAPYSFIQQFVHRSVPQAARVHRVALSGPLPKERYPNSMTLDDYDPAQIHSTLIDCAHALQLAFESLRRDHETLTLDTESSRHIARLIQGEAIGPTTESVVWAHLLNNARQMLDVQDPSDFRDRVQRESESTRRALDKADVGRGFLASAYSGPLIITPNGKVHARIGAFVDF